MRFERPTLPYIDIDDAALRRVLTLVQAGSKDSETGGILVGFNEGSNIRIIDVSDAGPNANTSGTHFLRDTDHCRKFLAEAFEKSGADYVGEWHSHVVALHRLSGGDLNTIAGLFIDPDYNFETFAVILVIVGKEIRLQVYLAQRGKAEEIARVVQLYSGAFPMEQPPSEL